MTTKVDEKQLLARFDQLFEQGLIIYDQKYRTVVKSDRGLTFEFRILDSHATKPQAPTNPREHDSTEEPGCRPGSDINVSGYELASIGATHLLTVNKFPSARPHYLILTQNGFRRQFEALDINDITAARRVISSFQTRHLAIFNCGVGGGCSRMHKHMQVFPAPEGFPLWPDVEEQNLPFKLFRHRFPDGIPSAEELLKAYQGLLRRAERALGKTPGEGEPAVPHNVVLDGKWIVVIPRRSATWDGIIANAAGMLGMVWVENEEKMNIWLERGPANVLTQLGVPTDRRG